MYFVLRRTHLGCDEYYLNLCSNFIFRADLGKILLPHCHVTTYMYIVHVTSLIPRSLWRKKSGLGMRLTFDYQTWLSDRSCTQQCYYPSLFTCTCIELFITCIELFTTCSELFTTCSELLITCKNVSTYVPTHASWVWNVSLPGTFPPICKTAVPIVHLAIITPLV